MAQPDARSKAQPEGITVRSFDLFDVAPPQLRAQYATTKRVYGAALTLAYLCSGIAYAAYMLTFRHAQKEKLTLGPMPLMCLNSLLCALMLGAVAAFEGESFAIPDLQSLWALLALALSGQVLGGLLIVWAMPQLPASVVGMMLLLQPGLSFALDVAIFSRPTTSLDWVGLAVSLVGIFLATGIRKTDNEKS